MATVETSIPFAATGAQSVPANVLDQLPAWNVLIPDRNDVSRYLTKFPGTGDVLPALSAEVRRVLGPDVELSLEVYHDPEIVDEWLGLFVRKDRYQAGFIDEIEAIRNRFEDALEQTTGFLLLTSDYHRPRGAHGV